MRGQELLRGGAASAFGAWRASQAVAWIGLTRPSFSSRSTLFPALGLSQTPISMDGSMAEAWGKTKRGNVRDLLLGEDIGV